MEDLTFFFTSRRTFDKSYEEPGASWSEYIRRNDMHHLAEVVSLDSTLNKIIIEPDFDNAEERSYFHTYAGHTTGLYTSLEYVMRKTQTKEKYNLMTIMIEPYKDCRSIGIYGYDFLGYDLVDKRFNTSALTNGGGFPEIFAPADLNQFGLMSRYVYAFDTRRRLLENNPGNFHADTIVVAIWRDQNTGR